MTQESLNGLAMIAIEDNVLETIKYKTNDASNSFRILELSLI